MIQQLGLRIYRAGNNNNRDVGSYWQYYWYICRHFHSIFISMEVVDKKKLVISSTIKSASLQTNIKEEEEAHSCSLSTIASQPQ